MDPWDNPISIYRKETISSDKRTCKHQSVSPEHPLTVMQEEAAYFTILTPDNRMRVENFNEHFLTVSKTYLIYQLFIVCHQISNRYLSSWEPIKIFIQRLNWHYLSWNHNNATWGSRIPLIEHLKTTIFFKILFALKLFKVPSPHLLSNNFVL